MQVEIMSKLFPVYVQFVGLSVHFVINGRQIQKFVLECNSRQERRRVVLR